MHTTAPKEALPMEVAADLYAKIDSALAERGAMLGLAECHPASDPMLRNMVALAEIGAEAQGLVGDWPVARRVAEALMVLNYGQADIR
jgi:hypothetical protein